MVVLVGVAAVSYYYVSTLQAANSKTNAELKEVELQNLALQHWAAIGNKNLTSVMQQYAQNAVLYWVDHPSSPLNGTYQGVNAIRSTWVKYFNANPTTYYVIFNFSAMVAGSTGVVNATLWYLLANGKVTLFLPYQLVYTYTNGSWELVSEYWGSNSAPGTFAQGIQPVP
ncbi:MAG: hypothetical protein QXV32_05710 [Conexivisphaerales archaeon]